VKDNNPNEHSISARTPDNGPYVSENAEQCKVNRNAQYYTVTLETFLQNALRPPQLDLLRFHSTDFHAHPQDNVCR